MAELKSRISLDTSPLATGLDKARSQVKTFASSASGAFAGMFAVGAVTGFFGSLIDNLARVKDLADRFGTSAESMQRLGYVADQNGTSVEGMASALQKANKLAADAANGSESAAASFARLGINAAEFLKQTPEEQLVAIARGLENSGSAGERLALAMDVMGKGAAELMPTLAQGGDAVAAQLEEAAVASEAAVNAIAKFDDQIAKLKSQAAATFAPLIGLIGIFFKGLSTLGTAAVEQVTYSFLTLGRVIKSVFSGNLAGAAQAVEQWRLLTKQNLEQVVNDFAEANAEMNELFFGGTGSAAKAGVSGGTDDSPRRRKKSEGSGASGGSGAFDDHQKDIDARLKREEQLSEKIKALEKERAEESMTLAERIAAKKAETEAAIMRGVDARRKEDQLKAQAEALQLSKEYRGLLKQQENEARAEAQKIVDAEFSRTGLGGISSLAAIGGGGGVGAGSDTAKQIVETQKQTRVLEEIRRILSEGGNGGGPVA